MYWQPVVQKDAVCLPITSTISRDSLTIVSYSPSRYVSKESEVWEGPGGGPHRTLKGGGSEEGGCGTY